MIVRIDKFLKVSRLIKRREVAKELCDGGFVEINGRKAKPSSEIEAGDELVLSLGKRTLRIQILEVRPFANKEQAGTLYKVLEDKA